MTTTGTYTYAPSASDLVINAYSQCQIRRTDLDPQKLQDAYDAFQLLMVDISNRNPNRWSLENQSQVLTASSPTYTLSNRTISIAIAYIDTIVGSDTISRVIGPISATEYGAIPNKGITAPPTSYWFNLQPTPTITLYPVPDNATIYTLRMVTFRQQQDIDITSGQGVDSPYRFLDAITMGLAWRLAKMYPDALIKSRGPQVIMEMKKDFDDAFVLASQQDQEDVPIFITPGLSSYFR
jgi:hypothetical protein